MLACKLFAVVSLGVTLLATVGCGGSVTGVCQPVGITVGPSTAAADHAAPPPSNSQVFSADTKLGGGAVCPQIVTSVNSNWTASDPSVHLSASPATQVTATCTAAVANVTITATAADGSGLTGHATLTCN